jgi:hypothetical protein
MSSSRQQLQLGLEDLLGDLRHARRNGDMGRLALISYCEVRRWARLAGNQRLAEHSSALITQTPHASREAFLAVIDELIADLEIAAGRPNETAAASQPRNALATSGINAGPR